MRVVEKRQLTDDVCELRLADPFGRRLPDWTPGSHVDLMLPGDHVRQYSLCGDRHDAYTYRVAVLREHDGRGGSAYVHDRLMVGDVIGIGGPRNNFRLTPAPHYLFVAGGIGITPILAMVRAAEQMGSSWELLYGGRSRSSMAYLDELEEYGDRVQTVPQDELGLLDLAQAVAALPNGSRVYCCGPTPLLAAIAETCAQLPPGALRVERFVAQAATGTGAKHCVRGRAGIVGNGRHGPTRRGDRRRTLGRRCARADLLPPRHLRHLRDRCRRR